MSTLLETTRPMLEVSGLTKTFGGYTAVHDVAITTAVGEVRAIIGPNGAGKTTLFNLLSGYLKPTHGAIVLDGVNIAGKAPHRIARAGVSRAFQTTNIFPTFTVLDNVLISLFARHRLQFHLWGRRSRQLRDKAENILEMVHLQDDRTKLASMLAHGNQRALEVAIALGCEPKALLLDEPTAGMSPYETHDMIALLERIVHDHGLTVLLSEHDMDVVFGLADQVTVMEAGRVLAQGPPEEIKHNPEVRRAYLGEDE
ncbi:MAG: ABC transporter ATP-binding protein [Firmicutes bacterium]|nr:ABC transporter ATP-binding protein [Bacillota bacterium]